MIRLTIKDPHRAPEGYAEYYASCKPGTVPGPPKAPSCAPRGADAAFFAVQRFYDLERAEAARFFRPDGSWPRAENFLK